jgi:sterol desaturase/sphingolipid hydroxylase (fatty acid hydroxylase superfamily)
MEHHLVQQNKNWGVTNPIWDSILGTRITKAEIERAGNPGPDTVLIKGKIDSGMKGML